MGKVYTSITQLVGNTPLLEISNYEKKHNLKAKIYAKLELYNPAQSAKDRIAYAMIEDAEKKGLIKPGVTTLVEATSGNTGIGLAAIAAAKGYKFRAYIQDDVSKERFQALKALGAQVIKMSQEPALAKTLEETGGDLFAAIDKLKEDVLSKDDTLFMPDQGSNPENPGIHERTTGPEIWNDTDGKVDILVAGVGTGGTVTGTGRYLKSKNPDIKVVAFQPAPQSLPGPDNPNPEQITGVHPFEGVPENFIPPVLDRNIYDEKMEIVTEDAYAVAREIAKTEGILVGISSGAALAAAIEQARRPENEGKIIVAVLPDTGLRYFSTNLFNDDVI